MPGFAATKQILPTPDLGWSMIDQCCDAENKELTIAAQQPACWSIAELTARIKYCT
jgi:hypothetical protein